MLWGRRYRLRFQSDRLERTMATNRMVGSRYVRFGAGSAAAFIRPVSLHGRDGLEPFPRFVQPVEGTALDVSRSC